MAVNWYFAQHKQRLGPFSWNQLRQLAAFGLLKRTDHVLEEGTPRWREASAVQGLFPRDTAAREFRLAVAGQNYGPFTTEQIRVFLLAGRLAPTTLGMAPGMSQWLPLTEIPEFTAYVPRTGDSHAVLVMHQGRELSKEEAELHLAGKSGDAIARLISRLLDLKRRFASNTTLGESLERNIQQLLALRKEREPWAASGPRPRENSRTPRR
jgi:hypothetical protein